MKIHHVVTVFPAVLLLVACSAEPPPPPQPTPTTTPGPELKLDATSQETLKTSLEAVKANLTPGQLEAFEEAYTEVSFSRAKFTDFDWSDVEAAQQRHHEMHREDLHGKTARDIYVAWLDMEIANHQTELAEYEAAPKPDDVMVEAKKTIIAAIQIRKHHVSNGADWSD